jgi:tRNA (guanosine-2'-O-)-methyltransferase
MISVKRKVKIDDILSRKQPTLQIMLDDVSNSQNLSAIIRSCDGVGILNLYYATEHDKDLRIHKTITQGTHRWINKERIEMKHRVTFLKKKQQEGFQVIATHLSSNSVAFSKIDYTQPTILIMGNEKDGVSREVLNVANHTVIIPMRGMAQSLNVSVATALILYEAERQLALKGAYDTPQLSAQKREKIANAWIYRDAIRNRSKGRIFY